MIYMAFGMSFRYHIPDFFVLIYKKFLKSTKIVFHRMETAISNFAQMIFASDYLQFIFFDTIVRLFFIYFY